MKTQQRMENNLMGRKMLLETRQGMKTQQRMGNNLMERKRLLEILLRAQKQRRQTKGPAILRRLQLQSFL